MITSIIIAFRETLEIALIVGIIFSYLKKTKRENYITIVLSSIVVAILISIIGAILFFYLAGGFTGVAEQIFEGIAMLIGAVLLTTMIYWMMNQQNIAESLEHKLEIELTEKHKLGIFLLVFFSILREGIELVLFLGAASFISQGNNLVGAIIGIILALILGYLIFIGSKKISIKKFFTVTNVLLIFFAAGLVAYGVHELQEAGIIPIIIEHIWDINPPLNADGSYPLLHENGHIGSILKGLFGYNGNPSLIEILSYAFYLGFSIIMWYYINKKNITEIS